MNAKAPRRVGSGFLSSDRLASLSDTIFGVAMTLLATTLLPYAATLKGSALDMLRDMEGALTDRRVQLRDLRHLLGGAAAPAGNDQLGHGAADDAAFRSSCS